ncbi:type III-B CRISPR module-associated protein Cmr3 [Chloracidobacterium validum]|uniref:Type III-B CRISPR module-associated protein Cmr3 n=1 Tax=Chloracidobacterium validum TaxID=2821543 RepID=A0ABX8B9Y2_9BACT|nr:type III-B CRISPR module-associated protein Cmr3 [Chloracidobacterium validum]QUW02500.1 type III-B CRISPR module-associated protein Cmr3 [Chloracidobacterium validum]
MNIFLQLTPRDPLIARDGRPFGAGQGNRMRGLPWPLPSVVAGSFRTALAKACGQDFSDDILPRLMQIAVAGAFPVHNEQLYLPAPNDALAKPADGGGIETLHRVIPQPMSANDGCDLPEDNLQPVMLSSLQAQADFKPAEVPAWWPIGPYTTWLLGNDVAFDSSFLRSPLQDTRDHVCLDAERGAAAEGQIFATANLNVTHLPRFGVKLDGQQLRFGDRFATVELSVRVTIPETETTLQPGQSFGCWHPLGGERRLVHWQVCQSAGTGWTCPSEIQNALETATRIRLILATPAIFRQGWKPDLACGPLKDFGLTLVGASTGRWKAVSGWSLATVNHQPRGPKPIRRMVPAGSVYFFTCERGAASKLADHWLQPVSDSPQGQRDGFGLALWGTW